MEMVPIREMVLEEVKATLGLCLSGPVMFRHLLHPHIPTVLPMLAESGLASTSGVCYTVVMAAMRHGPASEEAYRSMQSHC